MARGRKSNLLPQIMAAITSVVPSLLSKGTMVGKNGLVRERMRDGKKVQAFDVSNFKSLASLSASTEAIAKHLDMLFGEWKKSDKMRPLWERMGKPTDFYMKKSIAWKKGGIYIGEAYDLLVKTWNDTKGDVKAVSKAFGMNEWNEPVLSEQSVKSTVNTIREKLGKECPLYCPPEDKSEIDESLALAIGNEIFASIAEHEAFDGDEDGDEES